MKKELKMKHIFIPVIVVVIALMIVAAVISNSNKAPAATGTDAGIITSHTHADGEVHYENH